MYKNLGSKGKIGKLETKNRIVMSPMGIGLAELDGSPSKDMIAYYEARAKGGAGIIIPEITRINDLQGAGLMRQLSVTKDRHIEPLSQLARAVQKHGSKLIIQLHHPGRETQSELMGGLPVVAPSAIKCKVSQQETRALEHAEIKQLVQQFIDGAIRVKKAGGDGVELHAAHGYLINQFLSPYTNKREDEYGGSFENRMRFITEIIQGIRKACGDFPVGVRLSVDEFLVATGVTEDYIHIKDGVKIAVALEALGIDFIDVSCGIYETATTVIEPISYPQGWRHDMIKAVKDQVKIPVIGVSVIREPAFADQFIKDGIVDFVSLGRGFLADEDWGEKALSGRECEIRKCISCLRCFESLSEYNAAGVPAECAINPRTARERHYGDLSYDVTEKKAVVVGGGPAGLAAAETLALRKVDVTLIEKNEKLGGSINLAAQPPHKATISWLIDYYANQMEKLGVDVKLNTEATPELIASLKADAAIIATGGEAIVPASIPGIHGENVCTVNDVLSKTTEIKDKDVILVGAGMTGIETAEYLAALGNRVTIVEMLGAVAPDGYKTNVIDVKGRLDKYGVTWMLNHTLKEIKLDGVVVETTDSKEQKTIAAQAVVLSLGLKPKSGLAKAIGDTLEVHVIGDASVVGRVGPAVRAGFETALGLFRKKEKQPSFISTAKDIENHGKISLMGNQEGLNLAFLSDRAVIAKLLPPPLKPYPIPIVTLSVMHIQNPSFAEDYYETILGAYALCNGQLGAYTISLLLGGNGQEMATQMGRDKSGIPKKLGAEFSIVKNGDVVTASVSRKGVQIVDAKLKLGEYNSPLTDVVFQAARAGKKTGGMGFYYLFDCAPNAEGKTKFLNPKLCGSVCEYSYHKWEPGFATLKTYSSVDDPWAELPIRTIIGGAYTNNDLQIVKTLLMANPKIEEVLPYLLQARYDRTTFMETNNI
ncbi:acetoacetate decarboxylase family protein [Lachnospiraceae bacterium ZAX-1]